VIKFLRVARWIAIVLMIIGTVAAVGIFEYDGHWVSRMVGLFLGQGLTIFYLIYSEPRWGRKWKLVRVDREIGKV
jgi:hypothetical protein